MKFIITLLSYGLFSLLFSCKSTVNVITPEITNLKEHTMMNGSQLEKIWIDESVIVGIVSDNLTGLDSISEVLKELKLEWYSPPISRIQLENYGEPNPVSFRMLKKLDRMLVSKENSNELKKLRELYWDNFGPGIFYESGKTWGVLSNVITIQFERNISQGKIDELLTSINASKTLQMGENEYRIEYPMSWGYKVLDIAKELFELKEVNYVENQYRVINSRS